MSLALNPFRERHILDDILYIYDPFETMEELL